MTTQSPRLDGLDAELLLALVADPNATTVALAQRLSVSRNTVQARLQKLDDGTLASFQRRVTPRSMGYEITAFLRATLRQGYDNPTIDALQDIPEVIELFATTGDANLQLTVVATSPEHLYRVTQRVLDLEGIDRVSSSVVLKEFLDYRTAPLLQRLTR